MTGRLVTVQEVAKACGVSAMTVYRMVEQGDLKSVTVGKRLIRIEASSLDPVVQEALAVDDAVSDADAKEHEVIDSEELELLRADHQSLERVRALREKWQHEVTYGVWNRRPEYEHRLAQLDHALTPPTEGPQP